MSQCYCSDEVRALSRSPGQSDKAVGHLMLASESQKLVPSPRHSDNVLSSVCEQMCEQICEQMGKLN